MFTFTLIPDRNLTVVTSNHEVLMTRSDNPNWSKIMEALKQRDESEIVRLINLKGAVQSFDKTPTNSGNITVVGNEVFYKGKKLFGIDVDRIIQFITKGFPSEPMVNFLEKKLQNPSYRSIEQLYTFLEQCGLTVTPEGNFLAYKGIGEDDYSVTSGHLTLLRGKADGEGHIWNGLGEEILVPRNEVCDDFDVACSTGLHVGSLDYATKFGDKAIIVEVDPANVVSIPKDSYCQKLRCCGYKVVGEYKGKLPDTYTEEYSPKTDTPDKRSEEYIRGYDDGWNAGYEDNWNLDDNQEKADYVEGYQEGFDEGNERRLSENEYDDDGDGVPDGEGIDTNSNGLTKDEAADAEADEVEWLRGYNDGLKDGKGHHARSYYEAGLNLNAQVDADPYVKGYCKGYRDGRKDYVDDNISGQ